MLGAILGYRWIQNPQTHSWPGNGLNLTGNLHRGRCLGQTGLTSSILQMGPPAQRGPSDLTKAGAFPPRIQT
jgi:hypothetical protein